MSPAGSAPPGAPEPAEIGNRIDVLLDGPPGALAEYLRTVRAEDVAALLADYSPEEKLALFRALDGERRAEVIDETDPDSREILMESLPRDELLAIVEQMPPDEAADLVDLHPHTERERLLAALPADAAEDIRELLQHPPESAGGIMTPEFIAVTPDQTVREVMQLLQEVIDTEVVSYVYAVDHGERLVGVLSIRDLLAARPQDTVATLMTREVISADVDEDQEEVAHRARKYNLSTIPVLDAAGHLVGVATIDDLVDVLSEEADEDFYRLAGTGERHPTHQRAWKRALARLPWLLLPGLSGLIVSSFFEDSAAISSLALWSFVPLVMGISGAVGTQSSTILVRGLATGEIETGRVLRVLGQELLVGALVAATLAVLVGTIVGGLSWSGWISLGPRVPLAVGFGLLAGVLLATLNGSLLPFACHRVSLDPALVAGPFITSLNDVLASLSFLTIGKVILGS